jgi:hypothetical protein
LKPKLSTLKLFLQWQSFLAQTNAISHRNYATPTDLPRHLCAMSSSYCLLHVGVISGFATKTSANVDGPLIGSKSS